MTNTRGGKREGAGRKPLGDLKRINLSAKILPDTKVRIDKERKRLSRGKYIDSIVKSII